MQHPAMMEKPPAMRALATLDNPIGRRHQPVKP
jgi:hypothetical protein